MKDYRKQLISTLEDSIEMATWFHKKAQEQLERFDWGEFERSFNERKEALLETSKNWAKELKELFGDACGRLTDFTYTVPYDRDNGETIEWGIENGMLKVKVSLDNEYESKEITKRVTVPDNCNVDGAYLTIGDNKTATVVIPKMIGETSESDEEAIGEEVIDATEEVTSEPITVANDEDNASINDDEEEPINEREILDDLANFN